MKYVSSDFTDCLANGFEKLKEQGAIPPFKVLVHPIFFAWQPEIRRWLAKHKLKASVHTDYEAKDSFKILDWGDGA